MTLQEKKKEIARIKKIINSTPSKKAGVRYTFAELTGTFLQIGHTACSDDGDFETINNRLMELGIPTLDELREMFDVTKEKGSPSNHYYIEFRMRAIDRNRIVQARGPKLTNHSNAITG